MPTISIILHVDGERLDSAVTLDAGELDVAELGDVDRERVFVKTTTRAPANLARLDDLFASLALGLRGALLKATNLDDPHQQALELAHLRNMATGEQGLAEGHAEPTHILGSDYIKGLIDVDLRRHRTSADLLATVKADGVSQLWLAAAIVAVACELPVVASAPSTHDETMLDWLRDLAGVVKARTAQQRRHPAARSDA